MIPSSSDLNVSISTTKEIALFLPLMSLMGNAFVQSWNQVNTEKVYSPLPGKTLWEERSHSPPANFNISNLNIVISNLNISNINSRRIFNFDLILLAQASNITPHSLETDIHNGLEGPQQLCRKLLASTFQHSCFGPSKPLWMSVSKECGFMFEACV